MSSRFNGIAEIGAIAVTAVNGEKTAETAASGVSAARDIMAVIAGTVIIAAATDAIRTASGIRWLPSEPAQSLAAR